MDVCIKQQFLRRMVLHCAKFHDPCKLFHVFVSRGSLAAVCRRERPLFIVSQDNRNNNNRRLLYFNGSMMRQYNCIWTTISPSLHRWWSSWRPIERNVQLVPSRSISTSAPFSSSDKCSKNDQSDVDSNNNKGSVDHQNVDEVMKRDKELQSILREIMRDFGGPALKIDSDTDKSTSKKNSHLCMPRNNVRHFHTSTKARKQRDDIDSIEDQKDSMPLSIKDRFKSYDEGDAEVVLDTEELERLQLESQEEDDDDGVYLYQEKQDEFAGLSFERGKTGVFDMEELVAVLRDEKLQDIVVIRVPEELHYCNYMIIATALSPRHCRAAAEFIRKLYKKKKDKRDPYVLIEGENVHTWKCLDMGNIVLHLFLKSTRAYYDIESLWTLGVEFDEIVNKKPDHYEDLLEQHMQALRSMQPLPDAHQIQ